MSRRELYFLLLGVLVGLTLAWTLNPYGSYPLRHLYSRWELYEYEPVPDIVLNILLFIPLGALAARIGGGQLRSVLLLYLVVQVLATGLSLGIEVLQQMLPRRHPSWRDVLMNSLGAAIGFWIAAGLRRRSAPGLGRENERGQGGLRRRIVRRS